MVSKTPFTGSSGLDVVHDDCFIRELQDISFPNSLRLLQGNFHSMPTCAVVVKNFQQRDVPLPLESATELMNGLLLDATRTPGQGNVEDGRVLAHAISPY